MKKILLSLILIFSISQSYSQIVDAKVNLLAGAVAIFNPSIEVGFGEASAITMDYVGAFAKENWMGTGYPFVMSMGLFGYRHYLKKEAHQGWFAGIDLGFDTFRMSKNIVPFYSYDKPSAYDVGYGYIAGVTLGYKYRFNNRLGVEVSGSFGYHNCQHESFSNSGNKGEMSVSAEWIPYKAGIYLSYRIGNNK